MISKDFEDAKNRLAQLKEDPGNDAKLKIYALFKQVKKNSNQIEQIFRMCSHSISSKRNHAMENI